MLPPEPHLDTPFLVMSACAIIQSIVAFYFIKKTARLKKELDNYRSNNDSNNLNMPIIPKTIAKTTNKKPKGGDT